MTRYWKVAETCTFAMFVYIYMWDKEGSSVCHSYDEPHDGDY